MFEVHPVDRPYPGLRPFEPWESSIFFGRESHTDRLLEILGREHLLVVTGPSGSGKSSLVRAGLVPALPLGTIGRGGGWRVAIMRPGDRPIRRLAQSLLEHEAFGLELGTEQTEGESNDRERGQAYLQAELSRGPRGLVDIVTDIRQNSTTQKFDLLLLVDQFEEIFTYASAGGRDTNEADELVNLLLTAAAEKSAGIYVVLTLRTDFLGHCTRFLELPDAINRAGYLTPRLSRNSLASAISSPARVFGGDLVPELTAEMVNAAHNDPDQLPVLQHALARMWDRFTEAGVEPPVLTLQSLQAVGGVEHALSIHADAVLRKLEESDAEGTLGALTQGLFRCISEQRSAEAGGQLVRRPLALQRIADSMSTPWQAFIPVLQAFAHPSANFLTYSGHPGEPAQGANTVIDISHEALLRQWGKLKDWVEAEVKAADRYRELQRRAAQEGVSLLTGPDLASASEWFTGGLSYSRSPSALERSRPTADWARRYVGSATFADVKEYFQQSVEAAAQQVRKDRRRALVLRVSAVLMLASGIALAAVGYWGYERGLNANAQALWHRLKFDGVRSTLDEDTASGLLSLARADRPTRKKAIRAWLENDVLARRMAAGDKYVLAAGLGFDRDLRDEFVKDVFADINNKSVAILRARASIVAALSLTEHVGVIIDALDWRLGHARLVLLANGLASAADQLSDAQAQAAIGRLLEAMEKSANIDQFDELTTSFVAVARKLTESQAQTAAERLRDTIGKSNGVQLRVLSAGLSALAHRLTDAQVAATAGLLLAALDQRTDFDDLNAIAKCLASLRGKLTDTQIQTTIGRLLQAISKSTHLDQLKELATGFAVLTGKLTPAQAEATTGRLLDTLASTSDPDQMNAIMTALVAATDKLSDTASQATTGRLLDILAASTDPDQIAAIARGLAAVAANLSDAEAQAATGRLLTALGKSVDKDTVTALAASFSAVADNLTDVQAQAVAGRLLDSMSQLTNPFTLGALSKSFAAVARKLTDVQARAAAGRLLEAMGWRTQGVKFRLLATGFAAVADKLTDIEAQTAAGRLLDAHRQTGDEGPTRSGLLNVGKRRLNGPLAFVLASMASKLTDSQAQSAALLFVDALAEPINGDLYDKIATELAAVAARLTDAQLEATITHLLDAMNGAAASFGLDGLEQGFVAVAVKLGDARAQTAARRLIAVLTTDTATAKFRVLATSVAAMADKLTESQAGDAGARLLEISNRYPSAIGSYTIAREVSALSERLIRNPDDIPQWVEFCKSPFADRKKIVTAIRRIDNSGPSAEESDFNYLVWAARKYGVDVRASLKPANETKTR